MEIQGITLTDFKIHRDRHFAFAPGINAICGDNGAGKTSIIEAIAWVLFDHADYPKAELIRAGSNSAKVRVVFTSAQDGCTYHIQRCTSQGYDIYDPQLKKQLGLKKKEDVGQWLQQHLGLGRDLKPSQLFSDVIGIPQGTFTADFLKTAADRKKVFDPILRVEEYKQAYERSRELRTYAHGQVTQLEQKIQAYQEQLKEWPQQKQAYRALDQEIHGDRQRLGELEQALQSLQGQRQALQIQAETLQQLQQTLVTLKRNRQQAQEQQRLYQEQYHQAQHSQGLCETHHPDYQRYGELQLLIQGLEQRLTARSSLQIQGQDLDNQFQQIQAQQLKIEFQLQAIATADAKIQELSPLLLRQQHIEQELHILATALKTAQTQATELRVLQEQQQRHLQTQNALDQEIEALHPQTVGADRLGDLEDQRQQRQNQITHRQAAQAFATELGALVQKGYQGRDRWYPQAEAILGLLRAELPSPILEQAIATIEQGRSEYDQLFSSLGQLYQALGDAPPLETLQADLRQLDQQIHQAQNAQRALATLGERQQQRHTLEVTLHQLQIQITILEKSLISANDLRDRQHQLEQELAQLDHPRTKIQMLQEQQEKTPQLQQAQGQLRAEQSQIREALCQVNQELTSLDSIEGERQQLFQEQQQVSHGYQIYLQHLAMAQTLVDRQGDLDRVLSQLTALDQDYLATETTLNQQSQTFDPAELAQLNQAYEQTQAQCHYLQGALPLKEAQRAQLQQALDQAQNLYEELQVAEHQLQEKRRILQFIHDARQIFNSSGPRISQYFISSISREGDRLIRELLNRPDVALTWTEDYDIRLQESGHWRTFKSLSGGEQMCAALAVRLALLKILVDMDIAFFDEPTTNMDQHRRQQLADALSHLKSFRQLFIISHDDAFETMTENIIRVER
ncbi:SMC family ATPase [Candidatus Synechococcus calcipolaris G9]|uniref:Nuclease SbcCD subunit C n=1 Tax=Candidatus Synechococcus calcipolaris G9 TaxID=1497997 RepID=A0ABT6EZT2_9SYNE|nr:SMC family ATPase [Candidatus Synechococcus calcipolaris]MDG2991081.1 SMC family ATPase [Candidatus Synechococcus calcipolaris G9]